jgi:hypothetical protein
VSTAGSICSSTNNNGRGLRPLLLSLLVELVQDPDANNDEPKNEKNLSDCHVCLLDGPVNSVGWGFSTGEAARQAVQAVTRRSGVLRIKGDMAYRVPISKAISMP